MRKIILGLTVAALAIGTAAQADIKIDARQANQQRQIDAGKRSGKLSRAERDILTAEQHAIKRQEDRYSRSGRRMTDAEEAAIGRMLDRSQAHIERLKHNRVRGRHGVHINI